MVKITLEYGSVEEAIQALGKLSGLAKVRRAAAAPATTTGAPTPEEDRTDKAASLAPVAPTTRKGRNDKGKPRGPHKKAAGDAPGGAPVSSPESAPEAQAPLAPAEVAPQASPAASPTPSEADAKAALEDYFGKHGPQKAMGLLGSFAVSRLRDLPEDKRAEFIRKCGE